jgi:hypothetical protein
MLKKLKMLAVASLCSALFPSAVLADEFSQPPAAPIEEVKAKSCAEALRDAEFIREMKRTDGDTNPALDDVPECAKERADA